MKYRVLRSTAVPTHFYKVILGVEDGMMTSGAFIIPNNLLEKEALEDFIVPIESVENATGIEFFPTVNLRETSKLCVRVKCILYEFNHSKGNVKSVTYEPLN